MAKSDTASKTDVLDFSVIVEALSKKSGLPKSKVKALLTELASLSAAGLKAGKKVQIAGLGTLKLRDAVSKSDPGVTVKKVVLSVAKPLKLAVEAG